MSIEIVICAFQACRRHLEQALAEAAAADSAAYAAEERAAANECQLVAALAAVSRCEIELLKERMRREAWVHRCLAVIFAR